MVDEQANDASDEGTDVVSDVVSTAASAGRPSLPAPPVTGDVAVDEAVAPLADLRELPVEDHPAVFEIVHRALTDRLADVEG